MPIFVFMDGVIFPGVPAARRAADVEEVPIPQPQHKETYSVVWWPGLSRNSAKNLRPVVGFNDVILSTPVCPHQICQMRPRSKSVLWCPVIAARIVE